MVAVGSVAEKFGLKVGDLIIDCDNKELDKPLDLSLLILKKSKGEVVELLVERDGKEQRIEVLL